MGRLISAQEVAEHKTEDSCWFIYKGKVYDVTNFLNEHPGGGDAIVAEAGTDATVAFNDVGHSADAIEMMQDYYIGDLKKEEAFVAPTQPNKTPAPAQSKRVNLTIPPLVWDIVIPSAVGVCLFFAYKRLAQAQHA
ncbi:unnamed protein product, partial [Mesorhabditis spiculigera]